MKCIYSLLFRAIIKNEIPRKGNIANFETRNKKYQFKIYPAAKQAELMGCENMLTVTRLFRNQLMLELINARTKKISQ